MSHPNRRTLRSKFRVSGEKARRMTRRRKIKLERRERIQRVRERERIVHASFGGREGDGVDRGGRLKSWTESRTHRSFFSRKSEREKRRITVRGYTLFVGYLSLMRSSGGCVSIRKRRSGTVRVVEMASISRVPKRRKRSSSSSTISLEDRGLIRNWFSVFFFFASFEIS